MIPIRLITSRYDLLPKHTIAQLHFIKAPETFKSSVICIGLLLATEYKRSICVHHIFPHLERKVSRRSTVACVHHMRHPPRPKLWPDVTENSHIYIILLSSYKSYLATDDMEPQLQKGTGTRYFTTSHPTFSHPGWDGMSLSTTKQTRAVTAFFVSFAPPTRPMILKSHQMIQMLGFGRILMTLIITEIHNKYTNTLIQKYTNT